MSNPSPPQRDSGGDRMSSGTGSGLLDLFLKQREASPPDSDQKPWNPQYKRLNHKDEYTLEDISSNQRKRDKDSTRKGWRTKDGEKQYVTFRAGGKVVATGKDAFLLSRSDNMKQTKIQSTNTDQGSEETKHQRKKQRCTSESGTKS